MASVPGIISWRATQIILHCLLFINFNTLTKVDLRTALYHLGEIMEEITPMGLHKCQRSLEEKGRNNK